jgi:hypothetical protein
MSNSTSGSFVLQILMWYLINELLEVPESKGFNWDER